MKKMFVLLMLLMVSLLLPIVHAAPGNCSIQISDGVETASAGETLSTNADLVTLTYVCTTGNGTITYDVYDGDDAFIGTSNAASTYNYDISGESDTGVTPMELYVKATDADGSTDTASVFLDIDRTSPGVIQNLSISDVSGDIEDEKSSASDIDLEWQEPALETPDSYKVYYRRGVSSRTEITDEVTIDIVGIDASTTVDVSATGINLADGTITFSITALDEAGNESAYTDVSYIRDTEPPNNIYALVMKDELDDTISEDGISNTDTITLEWNEPTGEAIDHYNIYIKEGSGDYNFDSSVAITEATISTVGYSDGKLSYKVTSVDSSGNESLGIETYFNLDTTAPVFSVTYNLGGTGVETDISGETVNYAEKLTIDVVNGANDISRYSISTGADDYRSGDYDDLEDAIIAVSSDGLYTVKVKDLAGNIETISFTFDQEYPEIPANDNIEVTSDDLEFRNGIQADVSVTWDKSTDATLDHYELWINGELYKDNIAQPVGDTVTETLTLTTIIYGDVTNDYEVRTVDDVGNYGKYNIRRHITQDLVEPNAMVIKTSSSNEEIFFTVYLEDRNRDINSVYAVLYKNSEYQKKISITTGTNEYSFSGLDSGASNYTIQIEADYIFNGTTYSDEVINTDTVYNIDTLPNSYDVLAEIVSVNKSDTFIDLVIDTVKDSTSDEQMDVRLYDSVGNPIDIETVDLDTNDLERTVEVLFTGLSIGETYQVRIEEGGDVIATYNFTTEKDVPTSSFKTNEVEQNVLEITVTITDDDSAITESSVILLQGGQIVPGKSQVLHAGTNYVSFSGLDDNTEYQFKVYASYNLENGRGTVEDDVIGLYDLYTAKPVPTVEIKNIEVTGSSVTFDTQIDDPDNAITSVYAVLYDGATSTGQEVLLNKGLLTNREFTGLNPVSDYRINIHMEYDLNDTNGVVISPLFTGENFTTLKLAPTVNVTTLSPTNTEIEFVAQVVDPNDSYISGFVKLYNTISNVPLEIVSIGSEQKTFTFDGLSPETTYRIKVDADIDIGGDDGEVDEIIYSTEITTLPNIKATISNIDKTSDSISCDIDYVNNIGADVVVRLKLLGTVIQEEILEVGLENYVFENLLANTTYNIVIEYVDESGVLTQSQILTNRIVSLTVPDIFIVQSTLDDDNNVTLKVAIVDVDGTVDSDSVVIKICNSGGLCSTQEALIETIAEGVEVSLPYQSNIITVSVAYDAGDHTGTVQDSTEAIEKVEPTEPTDPTDPTDPDDPADPDNDDDSILNDTVVLIVIGVLSVTSVTAVGYMIYITRVRR